MLQGDGDDDWRDDEVDAEGDVEGVDGDDDVDVPPRPTGGSRAEERQATQRRNKMANRMWGEYQDYRRGMK